MISSQIVCHICKNPYIEAIQGYESFYRVTSDCKPWKRGGTLLICHNCGCIQKSIDKTWTREIEKIYSEYIIYHQSEGIEQSVFTNSSDKAIPRSVKLFEFLKSHINLSNEGRMLDIGCGNGAFLLVFSKFMPFWILAGSEFDTKTKSAIERIRNVEALYTCKVKEIPGRFQLITMIHVLEHFTDPKNFLHDVWHKQDTGGILFIQVPYFLHNPFDLLIADHSTHFTINTITNILKNSGYKILYSTTNLIPKEMTVIAQKVDHYDEGKNADQPIKESIINILQWLKSVIEEANTIVRKKPFGIFGTAIAATWLYSEINCPIQFFVDEDPNRVGKRFMKCPIYKPTDVPENSNVYIPLPTNIAESIKERLISSKVKFNIYIPPRLDCKTL